MLGYLKIFAQEGLGRPDIEAKADLDSLTDYLKKTLGADQPLPAVNVAMVFTDERVVLQVGESPTPAMKIEQLKEFLRKTAKQTPFSPAEAKRITDVLPSESVE